MSRIRCWWRHFKWQGQMPMIPSLFVPITREIYIQTANQRAVWLSRKPVCICGKHVQPSGDKVGGE